MHGGHAVVAKNPSTEKYCCLGHDWKYRSSQRDVPCS